MGISGSRCKYSFAPLDIFACKAFLIGFPVSSVLPSGKNSAVSGYEIAILLANFDAHALVLPGNASVSWITTGILIYERQKESGN